MADARAKVLFGHFLPRVMGESECDEGAWRLATPALVRVTGGSGARRLLL